MMRGPAALIILSLATVPDAALAHELWADGEPVPAWVRQSCCGISDAHHLADSQVHVTPDGYRVEGYKRGIRGEELMPSPDGSWWIFYKDYPDGSQSPVYCFFGPERGS